MGAPAAGAGGGMFGGVGAAKAEEKPASSLFGGGAPKATTIPQPDPKPAGGLFGGGGLGAKREAPSQD